MAKFKKGLIIVIAGGIAATILFSFQLLRTPLQNSVRVADQKVLVTRVTTSQDMARGLSGTTELREGTGMLFVYDRYTTPQFWMKDMNYPIDIIWIRDDRVIGVVENAPVPILGQELPRYSPDEPINYVLEVPAGFVAKYGVVRGSIVEY